MWILPKNYPLSSAFAADMVESKEDLTLLGLNIESSLMWRSKPSPLRTWSTRWKQGSYLPHLFTRILKPSQRTSFETALTSSLEVIRASRFQQQDSEREPMTQDTSGHLLSDTFKQLDLFSASLKMSKDTFRLDSQASSATWKKMVTEQRGEYSRRVKLAHITKEKESTFWLTPTASDWKNMDTASQVMLSKQVKMWPTPTAHLGKEGGIPCRVHEKHPDTNGSSDEFREEIAQLWLPEPRLGRVVNGCADRVDRLRLLGNGVVPQTAAKAYLVLRERLL